MRPSTRLALGAGLVVLAGCGSGHPRHAPTTGGTAPVTTSTRGTTGSASTAPPASSGTTTTVRPATTTTGSPPVTATSVRIASFTGPPSPVRCLAREQSVELRWTAIGAVRVTLQIGEGQRSDGAVFATYRGGAQTQLEPLTCDGRSQTYRLTAYAANGESVTRTLTLTERGP